MTLEGRPERITVAFSTDTAEEAIRLAKEWARSEPQLRIRTVCSVRRAGVHDGQWAVALAVRWLA